jgi:hypothetical protein
MAIVHLFMHRCPVGYPYGVERILRCGLWSQIILKNHFVCSSQLGRLLVSPVICVIVHC